MLTWIGIAAIIALLVWVATRRTPGCPKCGVEGNCCNCWYGD